jgi:hypothetical protein
VDHAVLAATRDLSVEVGYSRIPADAGSLRGDLRLLVEDIVASLTGPVTAAVLPALTRDDDTGARFADMARGSPTTEQSHDR